MGCNERYIHLYPRYFTLVTSYPHLGVVSTIGTYGWVENFSYIDSFLDFLFFNDKSSVIFLWLWKIGVNLHYGNINVCLFCVNLCWLYSWALVAMNFYDSILLIYVELLLLTHVHGSHLVLVLSRRLTLMILWENCL